MPNVEWTNKNTLQNLIDTIHARLITKVPHYSTMPTATIDLLGEIGQYVGETNANYINAYFYKCVEVEDEETGVISYEWQAVEVQNSTHISAEEDNEIIALSDGIYAKAIQMLELPVASEDYLNKIYEYIGETDEDFTNAYFYKCAAIEDEETGVVTYEWKEIQVQQPTKISEKEDNAILELEDGIYVKAVQIVELPEATEDNLSVIYQYIGESDEDYTNAYFYQCVEVTDPETAEVVYAWKDIKVQYDIEHIDLTMNEYNSLPNDKYTDDKVYFITDADIKEKPMIYGIHINPDESDPYECITYLEDAVGMTPMSMGATAFNNGSWGNTFIKPRPCMVKYDGTVDYYLDPKDYSKKKDGTASDIANPAYNGNAMMEFDLIWVKYEDGVADGEANIYFSNEQVDEDYDCPCNKDVDGNIIPHFYIGIYNGTGATKLRSLSGVTLDSNSGCGGTTAEEEIARAVANNTTAKIEWYTMVWCDVVMVSALHALVSHSLNSQSVFGNGISDNNIPVSDQQALKESYETGALDKKGLFWGDTTGFRSGVKTFGMENWYGCVWQRTNGMTSIDGGCAYRMTQPYDPTDVSDYTPVLTGRIPSGLITKMKFGKHGFIPVVMEGSTSTYYSDTFHKSEHHDTVTGCIMFGGGVSGNNSGVFCMGFQGTYETTAWSVGTRLTCKPLLSRFEGV